MNLDKIKLKDIKDIEFNIHRLSGSFDGRDKFVTADDAEIKSVEMKRDKLKVTVINGSGNEGNIYIKAKNQSGQSVLNQLYISPKIIGIPLESFENLELDYFK